MHTLDPVFARMDRIRHELCLDMVEHDGMTVLYSADKSIGVERVGDNLYVIYASGYGTRKRDARDTIEALDEFQW